MCTRFSEIVSPASVEVKFFTKMLKKVSYLSQKKTADFNFNRTIDPNGKIDFSQTSGQLFLYKFSIFWNDS